jgi:hypothetical protein
MSDIEVIALCEGHTERLFCNSVVAPNIAFRGIALSGTLVGKTHNKKGGIRSWTIYRKELLRLAKERAGRHLTVMVDFYGMPEDWPGRAEANNIAKELRGQTVENAIRQNLAAELPGRLHPCVQLHEFESLLFVDPHTTALNLAVAAGFDDEKPLAQKLEQIKIECGGSVEAINDSRESAPSKRIKQLASAYDKTDLGPTIAADVTLPILRAGCPWLNRWLNALEQLPGNHA